MSVKHQGILWSFSQWPSKFHSNRSTGLSAICLDKVTSWFIQISAHLSQASTDFNLMHLPWDPYVRHQLGKWKAGSSGSERPIENGWEPARGWRRAVARVVLQSLSKTGDGQLHGCQLSAHLHIFKWVEMRASNSVPTVEMIVTLCSSATTHVVWLETQAQQGSHNC